MLHILNRHLGTEEFGKYRLRAGPGATLLLIENGVYNACGGLGTALPEQRLCVLGPDLEVRGIVAAELESGLEIVDYAGFVALCVEQPVAAWF